MHRLTNNWSQSSVGFSSSCFPLSESLWQVKMQTHIRPITISKKKKKTKKTTNCLKHQLKPTFLPCSKFLHKQGYMYIKDRNSAKSVHLHNMNVFNHWCVPYRGERESSRFGFRLWAGLLWSAGAECLRIWASAISWW